MFLNNLNLFVQSSCNLCIIRGCKNLAPQADILVKILGIEKDKASSLDRKLKLHKLEVDQIESSIKFCFAKGFDTADLILNPQLLSTHPLTLDQHYLVLKESGFSEITPNVLCRFRSHTNDTIEALKSKELIPKTTNVVESLLQYLNPKPKTFKIEDLDDSQILSYIHRSIMKRYLKWRLDATTTEIETLFRVHKMIVGKSLAYLCENIAIAEDLNFVPLRKLLGFGYLLHMYPHYPKTVLSTMPNLAGADLRKAMRTYPKLTMVSPKNYLTIYDLLKMAEIPDETIQKSMNVFHVSPKTVKERLDAVYNITDFRIHLHNPKVLRLIIHHNRAKSRLSLLQEVKLKCASLSIIGSDGDGFDDHIKVGKDVNLKREVVNFVKHLLKSNSNLIKTNLVKHPYCLSVPLPQMEETYKFLQASQYDNESIFNAVQILLYPKEKIEESFSKINADPRIVSKRIGPVQRLNLALYYMEIDHHFSGNGVFFEDHAHS